MKIDFLKARRHRCFSSTWHRMFGTIDSPSFGHLPERAALSAFLRRPINWTRGRDDKRTLSADIFESLSAFVGTIRSCLFLRAFERLSPIASGRRFSEEFRSSPVPPLHTWLRESFGVSSNGLFPPKREQNCYSLLRLKRYCVRLTVLT